MCDEGDNGNNNDDDNDHGGCDCNVHGVGGESGKSGATTMTMAVEKKTW